MNFLKRSRKKVLIPGINWHFLQANFSKPQSRLQALSFSGAQGTSFPKNLKPPPRIPQISKISEKFHKNTPAAPKNASNPNLFRFFSNRTLPLRRSRAILKNSPVRRRIFMGFYNPNFHKFLNILAAF